MIVITKHQVSKIIFKSATLNDDGSEEQDLEVSFVCFLKVNLSFSMKAEDWPAGQIHQTFQVWVKRKGGKQRVEVVARQVALSSKVFRSLRKVHLDST